MIITLVAPEGSGPALALLVACAVLLDFGAQANLVVGFRAIFALAAEFRAAGSTGSISPASSRSAQSARRSGAWSFAQGGWRLAAGLGLAFPLAALIGFALEPRQSGRA